MRVYDSLSKSPKMQPLLSELQFKVFFQITQTNRRWYRGELTGLQAPENHVFWKV